MEEAPRWVPNDNDTNEPAPAEILETNFYFASIEDRTMFRAADALPLDHIVMETDYPHADSQWPNVQALLKEEIGSLPKEAIRKICFETACDIYRATPPPVELIAASRIGAAQRDGSRGFQTGS
jgi:predicted TIM-barrel fold metal-dependent hydrolase